METIIWTALGYTAIPLIFLFGFAITACVAFVIMEIMDIESLAPPKSSLSKLT
jgi:hypothetical protein